MTEETRADYEKRMASEYTAYVMAAATGEFVLNYMNWLASKKHEESQSGS